MHMEPRMTHEPVPHTGGLVGPIVVEDQMHVKIRRHAGVDRLEKLEKFLAAVTSMTLDEDGAGSNIERGEQGRGPVAPVVVGATLGRSKRHRQNGCRPV